MKKKIFTIIVTYNPDISHLRKSIVRLLKQTDHVVICNNSADSIYFKNNKIKLFNFGKNFGIAKAQNIGMEWAFSHGADFILQLDQDSLIASNMVINLVSTYKKLLSLGLSPGFIGPVEQDIDSCEINKKRFSTGKKIDNNIWAVKETISSGGLIPKHAYMKIGGNDERLFIDLVDIEFCWRLQANDLGVYVTKKATLLHKLGNGKKTVILNYKIYDHVAIRYFYQTRNLLLSMAYPHAPLRWKITAIPRVISSFIFSFFLFDNGKERSWYILKGIQAAILARYGKYGCITHDLEKNQENKKN